MALDFSGKLVLKWVLLVCLVCGAARPVAGAGIEIVGSDRAWPGAVRVGLESMKPHGESFKTRDPNFVGDGLTGFTGIRLPKLLTLAGIKGTPGLTAVGSDQYVGYLAPENLAQGFLVWEMKGKPVSGLKGGPLKLVFTEDAGIHASCYTWYVETLIADPVEDAFLSVTVGETTGRYHRAEMASQAVPLAQSLFSIAQGCRNGFDNACAAGHARAVPLSRLLPARQEMVNINSVGFFPFAGSEVTLGPGILDYPVFILVGCGDGPLHPALGGPFSVVFPVEKHPELIDMVPESGALFFLEKIVVK